MRYSISVVTDKHKFWSITVEMYSNGFKNRKEEKTTISVEYGVAKHRLGALMAQFAQRKKG